MLGLLRTAPLLLCWLGWFWLARVWARRARIESDWRLSWLLACVAWGTLVTLVTEGLSLIRGLTASVAAGTWWALAAGLLGWARALARRQAGPSGCSLALSQASFLVQAKGRALLNRLASLPFDVLAAWAVVVGLVLFLGWVALEFATTTGDSLTYHLARIMHWLQQQAVAHYPTHNCRQNELGPWAEYALAHLQLLWGNDRLLNLVQWFAMVSSLIGGTWIAEQLLNLMARPTASPRPCPVPVNATGNDARRQTQRGPLGPASGGEGLEAGSVCPAGGPSVGRTGEREPVRVLGSSGDSAAQHSASEPAVNFRLRLAAVTALLIVSVPIGIVESVTTQNDYVTTFWLVCLTALALALIRAPEHWGYLLGAGLAFGLGVLTKATMLLYAAPLLTALAGWLARHRLLGRFLVVLGLTFLLINTGHMARNYALVGSPLAGPYIHKLVRNDTLSVGGTWSNLIRNVALATPTPFPAVNRAVNRLLAWLHAWSGRGLNDPDITYELCLFSWPEKLQLYDSQASNPLHFGLILVAAAAVGLARRPRPIPALAQVLAGEGRAAGHHALRSADGLQARVSRAPQAWAWTYLGLFTTSFVLLCALLRWQEWNSRLHLAYLVVLMPWVAVVFLTRLPAWAAGLTMLLATAQAAYVVACNESRPLLDPTFTQIPREQQYMAIHMPHRITDYLRACDAVARSGVSRVGLKLQYPDFEYPLWVMLRNRGFTGRLDHVYVQDVSARLQRLPVKPEVVLTTFNPPPAALTNDFPLLRHYGYITLAWPAPALLPR